VKKSRFVFTAAPAPEKQPNGGFVRITSKNFGALSKSAP
jgi:hypothetical protein